MISEQTRVWLALSSLSGVGHARLGRLRKLFPEPSRILQEPAGSLQQLGLPADAGRALPLDVADREAARAAEVGARILSSGDAGFPSELLQIQDGPCLLYLQGETRRPSVAIVGTRRSTPVGVETARRLAYELASSGVSVVSGLARGIDTAAHRGALEAGGHTCAVLAGGLGRPYPPENRELLEQIGGTGAVVTEYAMEAQPFLGSFLRRNRWIAALADCTVVVEAPVDSGALKTARHARELGLPVFVAAGPMFGDSWQGGLTLLRDGANLLTRPEEILELLGKRTQPPREPSQGCLWPSVEQEILDCLDATPQPIEAITERSGLSVGEVRAALMALELREELRVHPGSLYSRL